MLTFCHIYFRSIFFQLKYSTLLIKLKSVCSPLQHHSPPFSPKANTIMNWVYNSTIQALCFYYTRSHKNTEYCFDFLKCTHVVLVCTYSMTCFFFPSWYVLILPLHVDKYKSSQYILIAILQIHACKYTMFMYSLIDYLSCYPCFGIMSNAGMNICLHMSLAHM